MTLPHHKGDRPLSRTRRRGIRRTPLLLVLSLACGGAQAADVSGSNAITVKPGDTGTCALSPCRISLVMPPGEGEYEVTGNEVKIGTYPAGETVDLGNYFDSQALAVKGAGVPKAYVYILKGL